MGLVSICVPAYRRPSLLAHALQSCFAQSYRPIEIDIGDDSPGDETEALVRGLVLPPGVTLRYTRNRPGLGQAANVNALFGRARGARLVLLHDDDILMPGALEALDNAWHAAPGVVAAYGMQNVLFENGEVSASDTEYHNRHANRTPDYAGARTDLLVCALWRQFPNNAYLIDSAAARTVGYRPFAAIGDSCDTDFAVRLALHARGTGAFAFIAQTTSGYRMSATGLNQSDNISWKFFDFIAGLRDLSPAESAARDALLMKIAAKATFENALHRRRGVALRIFFSRHYPRRHGLLKCAYHLGVIAAPQLAALRRFAPPAPRGG